MFLYNACGSRKVEFSFLAISCEIQSLAVYFDHRYFALLVLIPSSFSFLALPSHVFLSFSPIPCEEKPLRTMYSRLPRGPSFLQVCFLHGAAKTLAFPLNHVANDRVIT